jgi:hypothetical protein
MTRPVAWLRWKAARTLHALDALVLNYRWPHITAWRERWYPPGYAHECPWWAM